MVADALDAIFTGLLLGGLLVGAWEILMPYKSKKQERYLRAHKPEVAAQFDAHAGGEPDRATKFQTESHAYNWRTRNNLKQNQRAPRGPAAY